MEFICADPRALVRAANVQATLAAFKLVPDVGRRLVEKHALDIEELTPDKFIPVQRWLDALKEIQDTVGPAKVKDVGRNIVVSADFPPVFANAQAILLALDEIYHLNHKGEIGHYRVSQNAKTGVIELRCETPYPRMFEWGLVEGICRNKRVGGNYDIDYEPGPPKADLSCTIRVTSR
jgi:hypothetical protein